MARLIENHLSGKVGTLVFYIRNGKSFVRSRPVFPKKPKGPGNQRSQMLFTLTSRYGSPVWKRIRAELGLRVLQPDLDRLRSWLRKQLHEHYEAKEWPIVLYKNDVCSMNDARDIRHYFYPDITCEVPSVGPVTIKILPVNPRIHMKYPHHCDNILMRVSLVGCCFTAPRPAAIYAFVEFKMPCQDILLPEREFEIMNPADKGDLLFVVVSLRYTCFYGKVEVIIDSKAWMPATIVGMGRV